jgi:uncharacterized membrane protein
MRRQELRQQLEAERERWREQGGDGRQRGQQWQPPGGAAPGYPPPAARGHGPGPGYGADGRGPAGAYGSPGRPGPGYGPSPGWSGSPPGWEGRPGPGGYGGPGPGQWSGQRMSPEERKALRQELRQQWP